MSHPPRQKHHRRPVSGSYSISVSLLDAGGEIGLVSPFGTWWTITPTGRDLLAGAA